MQDMNVRNVRIWADWFPTSQEHELPIAMQAMETGVIDFAYSDQAAEVR
jgi:hypothetical protein